MKAQNRSRSHILGCVLALLLWLAACAGRGAERRLYAGVAAWLDAHALPVERVAAVAPAARYLGDRPRVKLPEPSDGLELLAALDAERPDYVVATRGVAWDAVRAHPWFLARYEPRERWQQGDAAASPVTLFAYRPSPFDAGAMVPVAAQFQTDAVTLQSYRVADTRVIPGEPLHVTLAWDDTPGADYADFMATLQLLEVETGAVWVQTAAPLRAGGLTWSPEARLTAHVTLLPPQDLPEGAYELGVALRDAGGRPVPLRDDADAQHLGLTTLVHPPAVSQEPMALDSAPDSRFGAPDGPIALLGYDAPVRAAPGAAIRVTLYWHAYAAVPGDYTVFVHLLSPAGEIGAQDDSKPVAWSYPTPAWQPGDYIRDDHVIALPDDLPRGDYLLVAGLYDAETGDRVPVYAPNAGADAGVDAGADAGADAAPDDHRVLHALAVR